jgi:hypothetical protein
VTVNGTSIEIDESGVRILDLRLDRREVAGYLRARPESERVPALCRAVEIGVFCLERAGASQDLEFVRRQIESLMAQVKEAIGKLPETTQEALLKRVGTADGQVLAPIRQMVDATKRAADDKLREVADLLSRELDPTKDSATLGRSLRTLRDLLDPGRTDSVQGRLAAAVASVAAADGALAETVKKAVTETMKPLAERVDALAKEVLRQAAAREVMDQTTAKGAPYEDEVTSRLQRWAAVAGAEVERVGSDNRKGDVLVRVPATGLLAAPTTIVVEVKNQESAKGREVITGHVEEMMAERAADAAIYLSRTASGFAKEIGDWAEGTCGRGPWVACTEEHLVTALRLLLVLRRIEEARSEPPEVDAGSIRAQVARARTALAKITTINRHAGSVRDSANAIEDEARALRDDVQEALSIIEAALRPVIASAASAA